MFSFIHISDLHIGKKLHGYDLYEDQAYILDEIVSIQNGLQRLFVIASRNHVIIRR